MYNDFNEIFQRICGYIKINSLSDDDYYNIIELMNKKKLLTFIKDSNVSIKYIYYKIDLFMLDYYVNYNYKKSSLSYDRIRLKVRSTFDRIRSAYPDYFKFADIEPYEINETISIYEIKKYFSIIMVSGYPHQVLVFCYLKILDGWTVNRIIDELSYSELEKLHINFINDYSLQTGYPTYIMYLFSFDMTERLNTRLKDLIMKNDSITPRKMKTYLNTLTGRTMLGVYFGKNKVNDISDWSIKVKKRFLNNFLTDIK